MTKIVDVEGIGETYAQKLTDAGIATVEALLEKCTTPAGRKELAETTEISPKLILKWANRADLARVKGICRFVRSCRCRHSARVGSTQC